MTRAPPTHVVGVDALEQRQVGRLLHLRDGCACIRPHGVPVKAQQLRALSVDGDAGGGGIDAHLPDAGAHRHAVPAGGLRHLQSEQVIRVVLADLPQLECRHGHVSNNRSAVDKRVLRGRRRSAAVEAVAEVHARGERSGGRGDPHADVDDAARVVHGDRVDVVDEERVGSGGQLRHDHGADDACRMTQVGGTGERQL